MLTGHPFLTEKYNMEKGTILTIVVLLGVLLLVGVFTFTTQNKVRLSERDTEASRTLTTAEDTPYTDLEGNPFSFESYRGQVRVVNSWASWCPFCTEELGDFEQLAKEYSQQDVAVIAINRKEPRARAVHFLDSLGEFEYTDFAIDLTDAYYISIGGFSMPETLFYDVEGNVVFHKRGSMTLEEMRQHTDNALSALNE